MTAAHPKENDVKRRVRAILTKRGWMRWAAVASIHTTPGVPDELALRKGVFLGVEVKLTATMGTKTQEAFMGRLRQHGGHALLVNLADVEDGTFERTLAKLEAEGDRLCMLHDSDLLDV